MADQITVLIKNCILQIDLELFFTQTTLAKQKKLLEYTFREAWRNEKTISVLGAYLVKKQAEAKSAWSAASKQYQNEYVCTQFRYDLTAGQKRTAEAANRKMLNEVKRCKNKYERCVKIFDYYETLKTKTNN
jgi:hypothetical protein